MSLIFGAVAGLVLAIAGCSVVDNPAKFVFLMLVLVVAHDLTARSWV